MIFSDCFLCDLCVNCLLHDIATARVVPFWNVPRRLSIDLICRSICRPGGGSRHECAKWRLFSTGYVCSVPLVFRLLCILWCDTNLLALDYVSIVYTIWFWRHGFGHLRLWTWKAEMFPNLLPLQVSDYHTRGAGYARQQFYSRYCGFDSDFCGSANFCLSVP